LLNPLIVGGAAWVVLVVPWFLGIIITRWSRRRRGRCMACGYPIGTSSVCTECGSQVVTIGPHKPMLMQKPD
jgi:hypothetical protein